MSVHLVSAIGGRDYTAETVRLGDLNLDGAPDLLFVQSMYGTRQITCLTATTIGGDLLWQTGTPDRDNGHIYGDLPVQICDWDGDGSNEVLYVRQANYVEPYDWAGYARERAARYAGHALLVVLDGATGRPKAELPLPAPADDCFLLADLTGQGCRRDLVVKDRYWNMWGVAHGGAVLWHYEGSVGHFPAIGDVDGDGRDEVFVGYALIDHDGRVRFEHDSQGHHQDACCVVQLPDGSWRLAFGNGGLHCLMPDGTRLWHHPLAEAQHVVPGRFRADSPLQLMAIARGQGRPDGSRDPAVLLLYDLEGRELWRREQPPGSWCAAGVRVAWSGPGALDELLVYSRAPVAMFERGHERVYYSLPGPPDAIYNGAGDIVDELATPAELEPPADPRRGCFYCLAADVWGDSREEVIRFGPRGASIHANARPLAVPTLYNETLYPGV